MEVNTTITLEHDEELGEECVCIQCMRERIDDEFASGWIDADEYGTQLEQVEDEAEVLVTLHAFLSTRNNQLHFIDVKRELIQTYGVRGCSAKA